MHKEHWLTNWTWFVTSCNQFLYHKLSNELWHRHILKQNRHHTFQTHSLVLHEAPNEPLSRASVCHSTNAICILNSSTINFNIPPIQKDFHTYDAITIEWPDLDWFMDNISHTTSTTKLLASILDGSALAVSDGSFYPIQKVGSCGWIISSDDGTEWIQGGGLIPGTADDQSAYRSELGGQVGILVFLLSLKLPLLPDASRYNITTVCDGKSALDKVGVSSDLVKAKHMHSDMISILSQLSNEIKFTLNKEHVKAHQDVLNRPLSVKETLNCKMDHLAKSIALTHMAHKTPIKFTHTELGFGTIHCNGSWISSRLQSSLYKNITHNLHVDRLGHLLNLTPSLLHNKVN